MTNDVQIFTDKTLNTSFLKNGYVKLKLLDEAEVVEILDSINKNYINKINLKETLSVSLWSNNNELKRFADNLIKDYLVKKLNNILINYEPIWGDILIKKPSLTKSFGLHQDWTFVDENQFTSINVWCPLQNVNYWNGCLQIVPQSHLFLDKIRGLNITPSYNNIRSDIKNKYSINLITKMGEAILFSHGLLHASSPNRTLKNRICIGLNLKPNGLPITHYILDKSSQKIKKYHVNSDYFINLGKKTNFADAIKNGFTNQEIDGIFIDEYGYKEATLSFIEFEEKLQNIKQIK